MSLIELLNKFVLQSHEGDLKTASYPKDWSDLLLRVSFGMGVPARVPWIAFIAQEMQVSRGFYPVYLYYKELKTLILAYGVSETEESAKTWPAEIMNSSTTIAAHFDRDVPRYGDSFVFKSYKVKVSDGLVSYSYSNNGQASTEKDIESDLTTILEYFKKIVSVETTQPTSEWSHGIFYMEKQLEDFIIENWKNTEFGKKYDLIYEGGEIKSQQYPTEIGPMDILAIDRVTNSYVVIELKKNQTSDDTIGQISRYMGWVREKLGDKNVKGIIIAGTYDKKLDYALKVIPNIEVFIYKVEFKLSEFKGS